MTLNDEIDEAIVWCKLVSGHKTARLLARLRVKCAPVANVELEDVAGQLDTATADLVSSVESAVAKYQRESREFLGDTAGDKVAQRVGESLRQFRRESR